MNKNLLVWILSSIMLFAAPAFGTEQAPPAAVIPKSLEQIASEVKKLLVKEAIQKRFDSLRELQEYGLTWQSSLIAPNDLVYNLNDRQLRFYAGVKLFDAIYATTFRQHQAVVDAVKTIEDIQRKLDLRSYADLGDGFAKTLKKFAGQSDSVNIQQLLEQLAADYVEEIPALMSNAKTADYLIDMLYGFTVEYIYVISYFQRNDPEGKLAQAISQQQDIAGWNAILVGLFAAFDRMNETIRVEGKTIKKIETIKQMLNIGSSPSGNNAMDASAYSQALAIRTAMLTFFGSGE